MIVVAGEALIDLVAAPGTLTATTGGAPYNVARACGRLGTPTSLAACVSEDGFGGRLRAGLAECGVSDDLLQFSDRPTTLALAELDADGIASYRFYSEGTSAPLLTPGPLPGSTLALVTGGLALALEPMAKGIERLVTESRGHVLVVVDVNARPAAITHRDAYLERVRSVTGRADVVKVSHEDLQYLEPGATIHEAAGSILNRGARVVIVTGGMLDTSIVTAGGTVDVPVAEVSVVDTIGAGDAFTAGFVTYWLRSGAPVGELSEPQCVIKAVQAGHAVAAVVVARRGADPPSRAELPDDWSP